VRRLQVGTHLRALRRGSGLSREQAGYVIRASESKISRMELGRVGFKERDIVDLLKLYGVEDQAEHDRMLALTREANAPSWWHAYGDVLDTWFQNYLDLEQAAELIRTYEVQFVPGLLQTPEYARAVMEAGTIGHTGPEAVERHVSLRMARQKLLTREHPPHLWVIIDETVLRRPVSIDGQVMRDQLDRLLDASESGHVTIQVAEFRDGPHPGTSAPFELFRFAEPELPDMVYTEYLTGALYLDSRHEVAAHLEVLDHMTAGAASAQRTKEIIAEYRDGY
jgi:hypothetical protein